jgi:hypothetical protein
LAISGRAPSARRLDGQRACFTLEDAVRQGDIMLVKVSGQTAIPAGRYEVVVSWSERFKRRLPLLLGVPNFTGVRIHPGNTDADTEGCILVGEERADNRILSSRKAFDAIFPKIEAAAAREKCFVTIEDGPVSSPRVVTA